MKPVRLRFFAEEGVDFCLWADEEDPGSIERQLPIPEGLRARMRAWITEFNRRTQEGLPGPWTAELSEDFDRRGYLLSRELQGVLGLEYHVDYLFETSAVRAWAKAVETSQPPAQAPHPRRLAELLRAVAVLALPAEAQRDWLAGRGGPLSGDGLAIDIYESAPQADQFLAAGWISRRASEQVTELDRALNEMSGPDNADLWSAEALDAAPEWERLRRLARSVLGEL